MFLSLATEPQFNLKSSNFLSQWGGPFDVWAEESIHDTIASKLLDCLFSFHPSSVLEHMEFLLDPALWESADLFIFPSTPGMIELSINECLALVFN